VRGEFPVRSRGFTDEEIEMPGSGEELGILMSKIKSPEDVCRVERLSR
jgi:hypothetical protein